MKSSPAGVNVDPQHGTQLYHNPAVRRQVEGVRRWRAANRVEGDTNDAAEFAGRGSVRMAGGAPKVTLPRRSHLRFGLHPEERIDYSIACSEG
jgi:hypothetical protein